MTPDSHLTREELARWLRHGPSEDRVRVVAHLADCDQCGAQVAALLDREVVAGAPQSAPADLVRRAYRVHGSVVGIPWWSPGRFGLAAALAAAVLVAGSALVWTPQDGRGFADQDAVRGTTLQAIGPAGLVRPPVTFRWVSPVAAGRYDLEVRDTALDLVMSRSTSAESLELDPAGWGRFVPGRTYTWEVIARSADGAEITRSAARSFVVAGRE
jgi:hypothetical protein